MCPLLLFPGQRAISIFLVFDNPFLVERENIDRARFFSLYIFKTIFQRRLFTSPSDLYTAVVYYFTFFAPLRPSNAKYNRQCDTRAVQKLVNYRNVSRDLVFRFLLHSAVAQQSITDLAASDSVSDGPQFVIRRRPAYRKSESSKTVVIFTVLFGGGLIG